MGFDVLIGVGRRRHVFGGLHLDGCPHRSRAAAGATPMLARIEMVKSIKRLVKRAFRAFSSIAERRFAGIETSRTVSLESLGLASPGRINYVPSGRRALRRILPQREVAADDAFLDVGSGKGRVLLEACRYPFHRIIGLEISPALTDVARANLERADADGRVELVAADASEYQIPDDVTVVYLYNPFRGAAFERLADNLVNSLRRQPRGLRVIYRSPFEEAKLLERGFRLVRSKPGPIPWSADSATRLYEADDPPRT